MAGPQGSAGPRRCRPYTRLHDVVFIDAIPVSAAGKVLKRELAAGERAGGGSAAQ